MNSYPDPVGTVRAYFDAIDARLQRTRDLLDTLTADAERAARQRAREAQRQQERLEAMRAYVPTDQRGDGRGITPLWEYLVSGDLPEERPKQPGKKRKPRAAEREALAEPASSPAPMWITPKPFKPRDPEPSLLDGLTALRGNRQSGRPPKAKAPALPAPADQPKRGRGRPRKTPALPALTVPAIPALVA